MIAKSVCFVLPRFSDRPSGGAKVVFEYANRLKQEGSDVSIIFTNETVLQKNFFCKIARSYICDYYTKVNPRWFSLDKNIKKYSGLSSIKKSVFACDIAIATAVGTAEYVAKNFSKKTKKLYLIQGFEDWIVSESELVKSYNLGLTCITVSKWLRDMVSARTNARVYYISNPIDTDHFYVKKEIDKRCKYNVAVLYHQQPTKGAQYAIKALLRVKEKYPQLRIEMFGTPPRPNLPDWVHYTRNATIEQLQEIYNWAAIYVCASIKEGYGLTGAEAMACGCALASSSFSAVFDYAIDQENALLSEPKDVDAMYYNIIRLIEDDDIRLKIALNGSKSIQNNNWAHAVEKLKLIMDEAMRNDSIYLRNNCI